MKVSENMSRRQFENPVLAYITPWNSKGYDLAKKFTSKLTHLSPVWYELKSEGSTFILEGRHNADTGWISEIRMKGNAKVWPTYLFCEDSTFCHSKRELRNLHRSLKLEIVVCNRKSTRMSSA